MGDRGQRLTPLADRPAAELGDAELGDDDVELVARRRDDRAAAATRRRCVPIAAPSTVTSTAGRGASGPRAPSPATDEEVLVPADPRVLRPPCVSARLAPQVDREAPLIVTIGGSGDDVGRVDDVDGEEPHLVVAVEPLVELRDAQPRRS